MVDRIEGKQFKTRTDKQESVNQNGEKNIVESIFLNEKLETRITSIDKDNDGKFDVVITEKFYKGRPSRTDEEHYDKQGRVVEAKYDFGSDGDVDLSLLRKFDDENNKATVELRNQEGKLNQFQTEYYENGRIVKNEIDISSMFKGPDGKSDYYLEYTYNDQEKSVVTEHKNLNGEIEQRTKVYRNENGKIKAIEEDKNLDGIYEERLDL